MPTPHPISLTSLTAWDCIITTRPCRLGSVVLQLKPYWLGSEPVLSNHQSHPNDPQSIYKYNNWPAYNGKLPLSSRLHCMANKSDESY